MHVFSCPKIFLVVCAVMFRKVSLPGPNFVKSLHCVMTQYLIISYICREFLCVLSLNIRIIVIPILYIKRLTFQKFEAVSRLNSQ